MPSQFLLDMSDMATPRQAALGNCEENVENAQDLPVTLAHTIAEAMHSGLVQLVLGSSQTAPVSPRALHCELCEIRIPPEYQAASCAENNFRP